jgi:hypothetical protein
MGDKENLPPSSDQKPSSEVIPKEQTSNKDLKKESDLLKELIPPPITEAKVEIPKPQLVNEESSESKSPRSEQETKKIEKDLPEEEEIPPQIKIFMEESKDISILDTLEEKIRLNKEKVIKREEISELSLNFGTNYVGGYVVIVIPNEFVTDCSSYEFIGGTFMALAKKFSKVIVLSRKIDFKLPDHCPIPERFLQGIFVSILEARFSNLDHSDRDEIQSGVMCANAQRVYGYFRNNPELGIKMLKKDNFFFNNSFGQKMTKKNLEIELNFYLEEIWFTMSTPGSADVLKSVLKSLLTLLREAALDDFTLEDQNKFIASNVMPFDEYISKLNRPIFSTTGKGKKKVRTQIGTRSPKKPRSTNLLLPAELKLILEILDPWWSTLKAYKTSWVDMNNFGCSSVRRAEINALINRRFQILERFGKLTTKRLQQVRENAGLDKSKKKKDISLDQLKKYLKSRADAAINMFLAELVELFGNDNLLRYISDKENDVTIAKDECEVRIKNRIIMSYKTDGIIAQNIIESGIPAKKPVDTFEKYLLCIRSINRNTEKVKALFRVEIIKAKSVSKGYVKSKNFLDYTIPVVNSFFIALTDLNRTRELIKTEPNAEAYDQTITLRYPELFSYTKNHKDLYDYSGKISFFIGDYSGKLINLAKSLNETLTAEDRTKILTHLTEGLGNLLKI